MTQSWSCPCCLLPFPSPQAPANLHSCVRHASSNHRPCSAQRRRFHVTDKTTKSPQPLCQTTAGGSTMTSNPKAHWVKTAVLQHRICACVTCCKASQAGCQYLHAAYRATGN